MRSQYEVLPREVKAYEAARAEVIKHVLVWLSQAWPLQHPSDPQAWFDRYAAEYSNTITLAQLEIGILATASVDEALFWQGQDPLDGDLDVDPMPFASVDGQGRPVMGQAYYAAGAVGGAIAGAKEAGGSVAEAQAQAWAQAGRGLALASQTMLSDTSRAVKSARMVARDTGWVRVLTPPSCARCAVLGGKYFRSPMANFDRHPGCDCTQMPVKARNGPLARELVYDAKDYFNSLSPQQQDKVFSKAGAQAIRDGADVNQIVNARRGMSTATTPMGRRVLVTTEGTTKRGWASDYLRTSYGAKLQKQPGSRYRRTDRARLMPGEIYKLADGDRDIALSLLHKNGFLTDASADLTGKYSWMPRDAEVALAMERARSKLARRGVTLRT